MAYYVYPLAIGRNGTHIVGQTFWSSNREKTLPIESKSHDRMSIWTALAAIGGAIVGAIITGGFSYVSHQRDLDAKMIELSVGILRSKPALETKPLREWAIDVLDKRAKFPFDKRQRAILLEEPLPFSDVVGAFNARSEYERNLRFNDSVIEKKRNVRVCLNETSKWDCPSTAECGSTKDACIFK